VCLGRACDRRHYLWLRSLWHQSATKMSRRSPKHRCIPLHVGPCGIRCDTEKHDCLIHCIVTLVVSEQGADGAEERPRA
jgi:hypothetical protein